MGLPPKDSTQIKKGKFFSQYRDQISAMMFQPAKEIIEANFND